MTEEKVKFRKRNSEEGSGRKAPTLHTLPGLHGHAEPHRPLESRTHLGGNPRRRPALTPW